MTDFVMPDLDEMTEGEQNISPLISEVETYRLREMLDLTTLDVTQKQQMLSIINQARTQDDYSKLARALSLNLILDRDRICMGMNYGANDIKKRLKVVLAEYVPGLNATIISDMDKEQATLAGLKVIISGGRDFTDYELLKTKCDQILSTVQVSKIVSGRCSIGVKTFTTDDGIDVYGADGLGERYAKERGYEVEPFPADWDAFGSVAGPKRNAAMAEYGNAAISFWDGKSRGTEDMIRCANRKGLKVRVIRY